MVTRPPRTDLLILPRLEGHRKGTRAIRNLVDILLFLVYLLGLPPLRRHVETQDAPRAANVEGLGRLSVARVNTVKALWMTL